MPMPTKQLQELKPLFNRQIVNFIATSSRYDISLHKKVIKDIITHIMIGAVAKNCL